MLFEDKITSLTFLLMLRTGNTATLNSAHWVWKHLQDGGMVDDEFSLTDKGWETANRLANEFGELL